MSTDHVPQNNSIPAQNSVPNPAMDVWGLRSDISGLKHAITLLTAFLREQIKNEKEIISCMKSEQSKMDEMKREMAELRKEIMRLQGRMK